METRKCGPSGGTGGLAFADEVFPEDCQVVAVRVYAQQQVHAVQIIHETCEGRPHLFPVHGSTTGECHLLQLAADEFIVSISGRFAAQVSSIRIQTNKQLTPLLGGEAGGAVYHYAAPPGTEIVGFWGRAGEALDAIGVILRRRGL